MSYQVSESMLDLITTIAMRDSEIVELKKRVEELESLLIILNNCGGLGYKHRWIEKALKGGE